jgi:hypothetical protein
MIRLLTFEAAGLLEQVCFLLRLQPQPAAA